MLVAERITERMKVVLKFDQYVAKIIDPATSKPITVAKMAEELGMNPRSITALKKGTDRGDWATLLKIADWLSGKLGRKVVIEELLEKIEEESDCHD